MSQSQKSKRVSEFMGKLEPGYELPDPDQAGSLLEFGLLCVMARRLTKAQCAATLRQLRSSFIDWNDLRIAQIQEVRPAISTKDATLAVAVARDVKTYLQEVFQASHGFDLEFLREDPAAAAKFLAELPFLGGAAGHDLLWAAVGRELPVTPAMVRVLDRLGLAPRSASLRKAREAIEPLVPKGQEREFAVLLGRVADLWCDARKPICQECAFLDDCPHGGKVFKEWQAQQKRLEAQRKREEVRAEALRKKEEARRKREEERERKRREAEERKRAREEARAERERERKAREEERKRARAEADRQREEERKKKAAAKKKEEAKKKAAAKKKPAKKASASRKKKAKSSSSKKGAKTAKKSSKKTAASKKKATKKKTGKAGTARKKTASKKKPATKRPSTRKKSTTRRKR